MHQGLQLRTKTGWQLLVSGSSFQTGCGPKLRTSDLKNNMMPATCWHLWALRGCERARAFTAFALVWSRSLALVSRWSSEKPFAMRPAGRTHGQALGSMTLLRRASLPLPGQYGVTAARSHTRRPATRRNGSWRKRDLFVGAAARAWIIGMGL